MAVSTIPKEFRLKSISKADTLGANTAGQSGYAFTTMPESDITNVDQIVSVTINSLYVSAKEGFQITPYLYNVPDRRLYFQYYAPRATQSAQVTFTIWYID